MEAQSMKQERLEPLNSDAANARAIPSGNYPARAPRASYKALKGMGIASSKSKMTPRDIGYCRSKGEPSEAIYLLCPFHAEKTPSCVVYPKGRIGPPAYDRVLASGAVIHIRQRIASSSYFHCYGCKQSGGIARLFKALRNPVKVTRYQGVNPDPALDDRDIPF